MGGRKKNLVEIFSYTTIVGSMALMSGLALGHATEQSMHPRLSANPPLDPVERFGLGQNGYATTHVKIKPTHVASREYTDANYEIGRYVDGARVLAPFEPARKTDRIRLEKLQAWNDQNFGTDADMSDESFGYAASNIEDHQPIDVGAVEESPAPATVHAVSYNVTAVSVKKQDGMARDEQQFPARSETDDQPVFLTTDGAGE